MEKNIMNMAADESVLQAEQEVHMSNQQLEKALNQLKGSLEDGTKTANLIAKAMKDPILLSASAFLIGIYLGETLRNPR